MTALYPDTHPKMEALQIQLWRQASPTQKMNMVAQLNAAARTLALTGLRIQYPQASEAELRRKLATLLLGEELACKLAHLEPFVSALQEEFYVDEWVVGYGRARPAQQSTPKKIYCPQFGRLPLPILHPRA